MKKLYSAAQRHHFALLNARLVIPESAETVLAKFLLDNKLLQKKHDLNLICTHIEPDHGCGFFDFGIYCRDANAPVVRAEFQNVKKKLLKKAVSVSAENGSCCHIQDIFLLSEELCPSPANGVIFFGRIKIDLDRSAFHIKDAAMQVSGNWDYAGAEEQLKSLIPCRLIQIDIDFAQEPELLFLTDIPLDDHFQVPDCMVEVTRNSKVLLVRLVPQEQQERE